MLAGAHTGDIDQAHVIPGTDYSTCLLGAWLASVTDSQHSHRAPHDWPGADPTYVNNHISLGSDSHDVGLGGPFRTLRVDLRGGLRLVLPLLDRRVWLSMFVSFPFGQQVCLCIVGLIILLPVRQPPRPTRLWQSRYHPILVHMSMSQLQCRVIWQAAYLRMPRRESVAEQLSKTSTRISTSNFQTATMSLRPRLPSLVCHSAPGLRPEEYGLRFWYLAC